MFKIHNFRKLSARILLGVFLLMLLLNSLHHHKRNTIVEK
ncbi:hypothetical protein HMPREF3202_00576 [Prevotella bivia]|uniref:Uncharacterized protein n=1 Tax=Prevotella bivia TaxID=28125 RepID=A0A137SZP1_9BACT|nr:hypothetical protein HMPREF3202_00576 [Prevotella bivia]